MGKMMMYSYMWVEKNFSDDEIQSTLSFLTNCLSDENTLKPISYIKPTKETDVHLMVAPQKTIVKMTKKEHVDSFFDKGTLQLGSFEYYARHEHGEIGDKLEGSVTLIAERSNFTAFGTFGGGFDQYLFCAYAGEPDVETLEKFGYDSGFIIKDPKGFAKAVQKALNAKNHEYACCIYNNHKVLRGKINPNFDMTIMDHRTIEMLSTARHFIKPAQFSHQSEFRFTWNMPIDVSDPLLIECPEAIQYCERLQQ